MKPEHMAFILRATNDAKSAIESVVAVWAHHGVGTDQDHERMRLVLADLEFQGRRFTQRLESALKAAG